VLEPSSRETSSGDDRMAKALRTSNCSQLKLSLFIRPANLAVGTLIADGQGCKREGARALAVSMALMAAERPARADCRRSGHS
jgi:hypothetical protein